MTRALVTGASGFIGAHLVAALQQRGVEVLALCRPGGDRRLPAGVRVIPCAMDAYPALPDLPALQEALAPGKPPQVFYHLAWEGASGPGRGDASLQAANAARTLQAIAAAKALGCKKFIATGTVYENFQAQIAAAPQFRNAGFYILSKVYARDMGRQLALQLGLTFVWCTFCHPIGRRMKPEQLLAYTVARLLEGTPPEFGPAEDLYDLIAVEDLAAALCLAGTRPLTGWSYYIGGWGPRPLRAYLEETRRVLNVPTPLAIGAKPHDGLRFDGAWFDGAPFAGETGFAPQIPFADAVRATAFLR